MFTTLLSEIEVVQVLYTMLRCLEPEEPDPESERLAMIVLLDTRAVDRSYLYLPA
jgi:hypothetical protein